MAGSHSLSLWLGWWTYGWDALMLNGIPADILIGGAILFGPVLYFWFPRTAPLIVCLPIVACIHGTLFGSLRPLVQAGPHWLLGVVFVFLIAHIPAIHLVRWTEGHASRSSCHAPRDNVCRPSLWHTAILDHVCDGGVMEA